MEREEETLRRDEHDYPKAPATPSGYSPVPSSSGPPTPVIRRIQRGSPGERSVGRDGTAIINARSGGE